MLDLMRKHAYSWMTRAVVILLIGVFAFWGVSTGMFSRIKPVATVAGHQILSKDLDQETQLISFVWPSYITGRLSVAVSQK